MHVLMGRRGWPYLTRGARASESGRARAPRGGPARRAATIILLVSCGAAASDEKSVSRFFAATLGSRVRLDARPFPRHR